MELNERSRQVLFAIVQSYIERPDPVGSRFVTRRYGFRSSPATIRNIMADLEESGYLSQPHTSAGRIPTDKGFRFYVDSLYSSPDEGLDEHIRGLGSSIEAIRADAGSVLAEVTRRLSDISHQLAFAAPIRPNETTLNRIQLYGFRGNRIAAVVLTDEGVIKNTVLENTRGLSQRDLNGISDYLNSEFSGNSIDSIRAVLAEGLSRDRKNFDILISHAHELFRKAMSFQTSPEVFVSGLTELLALPEISSKVKHLAKAIEEKHLILSMIEDIGNSGDINVFIGSENPREEMKGLSLVCASYCQGGMRCGNLGIIGPTRMDYSRIIPMIKIAAMTISEALTENGGRS